MLVVPALVGRFRSYQPMSMSLLRTCKQIHNEATGLLYCGTTFSIEPSSVESAEVHLNKLTTNEGMQRVKRVVIRAWTTYDHEREKHVFDRKILKGMIANLGKLRSFAGKFEQLTWELQVQDGIELKIDVFDYESSLAKTIAGARKTIAKTAADGDKKWAACEEKFLSELGLDAA
ncbi:hypothetical protein CB0940_04395 [Cercospora beticola]|uniref:Uncharacterized protein n=1 Tax=Cercospora beticola TaxID=122368 RepID=A0A2G5HJ71_CERBT|nr:hypothetical protein CB0940_04395 [Cercospora beticola]PIA92588.1 hypothetical protein CB0940_04395 [Cercospora beticola]WPB01633.1 hypothetical protein RHO25_006263 [Cercospora beticola]CAK1363561.1 unnamed protein product [Cercospora beticola]